VVVAPPGLPALDSRLTALAASSAQRGRRDRSKPSPNRDCRVRDVPLVSGSQIGAAAPVVPGQPTSHDACHGLKNGPNYCGFEMGS